MESTEVQIRKLLAKLAVAGEAESITLAAELRVLLHSQMDSLRERASTLLVLPGSDKSSNAALLSEAARTAHHVIPVALESVELLSKINGCLPTD